MHREAPSWALGGDGRTEIANVDLTLHEPTFFLGSRGFGLWISPGSISLTRSQGARVQQGIICCSEKRESCGQIVSPSTRDRTKLNVAGFLRLWKSSHALRCERGRDRLLHFCAWKLLFTEHFRGLVNDRMALGTRN